MAEEKMKTQVAIYSTDRSPNPNYCPATLKELCAGGASRSDISVYVSGTLGEYLRAEEVAVVERDEGDDSAARSRVHNASFNMRRAILCASTELPLYLCEDDIAMAPAWLARAEELSLAISKARVDESQEDAECFTLALFFPYGAGPVPRPDLRFQYLSSVDPSHRGWWQEYAASSFWGNQCLRFSPSALSVAQQWLKEQPGESLDMPPDMVVKNLFLSAKTMGLYGCLPSLAQHIGDVSVAFDGEDGRWGRWGDRKKGGGDTRDIFESPVARNFDQMGEK